MLEAAILLCAGAACVRAMTARDGVSPDLDPTTPVDTTRLRKGEH